MEKVIKKGRVPLKLWLSDIEKGALEQAEHLTDLPFSFSHVAIMPDAHQGYGMPIGGVLALKDTIIPNAVGVDIGCGMCALKTSQKEFDKDRLQKIVDDIRKVIPTGFDHHKRDQDKKLMPQMGREKLPIVEHEYKNALRQIGTLGGGNHFIEIQKDENGWLWIMIHSGSRNIGYKVANYYNKLAAKLNEKWKSPIPRSWQLAYLPLKSDEGQTYLNEMNYCIEFAFANRKLMMRRVKEIFSDQFPDVKFAEMINIAHNYAALEKHFGQKVMIHRKGATRAFKNEYGIIPGSQGSASYIVRGKGNPESFMSCSHGAGRKMGRNEARRRLDLKEESGKLEKLGIIHALHSKRDLDEASGAYKNISEVIHNQLDLIDIEMELKPLAVVKG
jgi:tRNA-splicing ligase RtcB